MNTAAANLWADASTARALSGGAAIGWRIDAANLDPTQEPLSMKPTMKPIKPPADKMIA